MVPLQAGGCRLWRAAARYRRWSLSGALFVSLLLGAVLGQSSLATAQQSSPSTDPGAFLATGYRVSSPEMLDYFQRLGGVRTFGYPVSNEFPLLGQRAQLFQRAMLLLGPDGSVTPADLLSPDMLPVTHIDGLSLPPPDPEVQAAAPTPDQDDYATQVLAYVNLYVPDSWNGLPVNFQQTFLNSVTCADAFGSDDCDPSQLAGLDLQVWGLPTSLPTSDPLNPDFVYQRFERGIMHFSASSGVTQGLLLGDWLKRVLVGVDLSPDINPEVRQSRFFAQYAPSQPLALDRPDALPDSSLAQAFNNDSLMAAGQSLAQAQPTLPTNVAQTATSVALTSTAISATQAALSGGQNLTATAAALTPSVTTPTAAASVAAPAGTPAIAAFPTSSIPVINVGCLGDEQMWFVPRKPYIGTHVQISVTSQRHHDVRFMMLGGPLDAGPVTERQGPLGFIWTWTVSPTVEDFYQWTFFADGLRPCITSGFNAVAPLGATPTPTETPVPTGTPGTVTATPTATSVPAPTIQAATAAGTCGSVIQITGTNFGSPPSSVGTSVQLLGGPQGSGTPLLLNLIGGSGTQLTATLPSSGLVAGGGFKLVVANNGGASNTTDFTVTACGGTTASGAAAGASANEGSSATAAPTPPGAPTISALTPMTATCGTTLTIDGTNFGAPPSSIGTQVQLLGGPATAGTPKILASVGPGTSTRLTASLPTSAVPGGAYMLAVTTDGGASNQVPLTVSPGC